MITGPQPSLKHARVFECAAYVLKMPPEAKLAAMAMEGILVEVLVFGVYRIFVKNDQ